MTRAAMYAQAVRGPIVLMTVGALFAMHEAGLLSLSRTWPLVIIVIGVMKLIERMALPTARPAAPNPFPAGYPQQPSFGYPQAPPVFGQPPAAGERPPVTNERPPAYGPGGGPSR